MSGFVSYAWMRGEAELPVTGGLFLGDEDDLGEPGDRVALSQDQRHTLRGRVSAQLAPRAWVAVAGAFDSGLPFEDVDDDDDVIETTPPRVLEQVDLEAGRVRPAATFNLIGYWVLGLPAGAWLAFRAGHGLAGIWWGLCFGLAVVATSLVLWVRSRGPRTAVALVPRVGAPARVSAPASCP